DVGVTGVSAGARQRQRAAADLGQTAPGCVGAGAALEPSGTAIADDAADCGTEVVAADGELVRAEKIIARPCNRAGTDIAVAVPAGRIGEIDDAAGIGDELRVATVAVVVELRAPTAVRQNGRVGGGAVVVELSERTVVRDDGRIGGGAVVVERDHAAVVVGDGGVSGRTRVVEVQIVVVGKTWRERG